MVWRSKEHLDAAPLSRHAAWEDLLMRRVPVSIVGTGIVFEQPEDPVAELLRWRSAVTPELRQAIADWRAGRVLLLTHAAFVEFKEAGVVQCWSGTPQGPYPISTRESATSPLLGQLEYFNEDLLSEFGIAGFAVSRFDFYAAPRRIEISDDLRARLLLD